MTGIFIAGNFLSKKVGVRSIGEELAERLNARNWHVITASDKKNRIHRMIDYLWTAWHYRKEYSLASLEVYSGMAFRWSEVLCWFLRLLKKPYVLTLHGGKLPEFAIGNSKRIKRLLSKASAVTTPSKYLLHYFTSYHASIKYTPNGISIERYPYAIRETAKPNLIWLRAFDHLYQPTMAIEVLQRVRMNFPDVSLTMIGPDNGDGTYKSTNDLINMYSLQDKVRITGAIPKNEIGNYLAKGDVFLNTTRYESFGVSVLEAAACGLCIVTTNVGELPYLWEDGKDALLVISDNPQSMADAVIRVLTEKGLAQTLSQNARMKAERYDWASIIPQWEQLFLEISRQSQNNQIH